MILKNLSRLAMLSALCVVLRLAFATLPNIQPLTAIFLVVAVAWGLAESLAMMTISMLVTSFVLGFGPWVPYQLLAFALIIFLWRVGFYPVTSWLKGDNLKKMGLEAFLAGGLAFIYGVVIDSLWALSFQMPWWSYVAAGLPFNLSHAWSTVLFYPIIDYILRRFLT